MAIKEYSQIANYPLTQKTFVFYTFLIHNLISPYTYYTPYSIHNSPFDINDKGVPKNYIYTYLLRENIWIFYHEILDLLLPKSYQRVNYLQMGA